MAEFTPQAEYSLQILALHFQAYMISPNQNTKQKQDETCIYNERLPIAILFYVNHTGSTY